MEKEYELTRFSQAAAYLPERLRHYAMGLSEKDKARVEEFRLRAGRKLSILLDGREVKLGGDGAEDLVTSRDVELLCSVATDYSRYAAIETVKKGYITVQKGFRIGLCGTTVVKEGGVVNLKELSSAAIRISREYKGIAEETARRLFVNGRFQNTLIVSPPGAGKTTFLRDLVRCLGDGREGRAPKRVALVDERSEIAAVHRGMPQMDVGEMTDVLDGCPKAEGITMVLRAMNPEIIAVDEITAAEDIAAMTMAANCGTGLLATIHGRDLQELCQKPLYESLLRSQVFSRLVTIERLENGRAYRVEEL